MKLEDKQTAVEWLFRSLWDTQKDKLTWWAIFDDAMAIENQQIIMGYHNGYSDAIKAEPKQYEPEQYYDDTYGN